MHRSYLFAPGSNDRLIGKVFAAGADAVVLDLEDGVAPDHKRQAREMVADALSARQKGEGAAVYVRVNGISTSLWRDDVRRVVAPALDGIRLAKAESVSDIETLDEELSVVEEHAGIPRGSIAVVPTIESARGVLAAQEIARHPRVESLCFGAADFVLDVGAEPDSTGLQLLYAQSHLVLASRAAQIRPPVASVYTRVADLEGLRASSVQLRRLGFFGRSCVHPSQIAVIHEVFSPSEQQVAEAVAILEAFQRSSSDGSGAFLMPNGHFVDRAVAHRARDVVELSQRALSQTRRGS